MPAKPIAIVPLAIPLANITSGNARSETPASHLAVHRSPGLVWRSNGNSSLWVKGSFASAQAIDFVAMLAANAQVGTTIRVRLGSSEAAVDGGGLIDHPNAFDNAFWIKRGTAAVSANAAVAPDGTTTADRLSGLAGIGAGDIYNSDFNTEVIGGNNAAYTPQVWIKRVSTSGVLRLVNATVGASGGDWRVNLASLNDDWNLIQPGHPALTITTAFVTNGSGLGGVNFSAFSGGPLTVDAWGAQIYAGTVIPYDSGFLPFISPAVTTDNGLYNSHLEIPAVQNATWFRIDIGGHSGDFSAAHLVLGKAIRPARYYDRGFERGFEDLGDHELSRWGVASQSGGFMLRTLSFRLGWISREEMRTDFEPMFRRQGRRNPVLWCFDPEASIYRQSHTYFGWIKQQPVAVQGQKPNTYGVEFNITSII